MWSAGHGSVAGFLSSSSVRQMWSPHVFRPADQLALPCTPVMGYGLGWFVKLPPVAEHRTVDPCDQQDDALNVMATAQDAAQKEISKSPNETVSCNKSNCQNYFKCPGSVENHCKTMTDAASDAPQRNTTAMDQSVAGYCNSRDMFVYHTGAAIGGSSVLMISPEKCPEYTLIQRPYDSANTDIINPNLKQIDQELTISDPSPESTTKRVLHSHCVLCSESNKSCDDCSSMADGQRSPSGVVVAILSNYTGVNFAPDAIKITKIFKTLKLSAGDFE